MPPRCELRDLGATASSIMELKVGETGICCAVGEGDGDESAAKVRYSSSEGYRGKGRGAGGGGRGERFGGVEAGGDGNDELMVGSS